MSRKMMDKTRIQTNKKLNKTEREIGRIYKSDPALKRIIREYMDYMKTVKEKTQESYDAYMNETDRDKKEDLKKEYMKEVRYLTTGSKQYRKLVKRFTEVMADVNQKALDIVNDTMTDIYCMNYNEVATECKKVGIKVNGKK